ncbi:MAG TPA: hypothetical protein VFJ95_06945, partial [Gammaproteobacteria bacterium]|nr:hypothetical protein [Gammaproteobacteria bacterium]
MSRARAPERKGRDWPVLAAALASAALTALAAEAPAAPLTFRLDEGRNINSFTRDGDVAAHLLLRSGDEPRILVAFPAGNSGVAVWFTKTDEPVEWQLVGPPRAVTRADSQGRPLRGIEADVQVDAQSLRIDRAVLSSVRVLRDFELLRTLPQELFTAPVASGQTLSWERDRLDGAPGYRLVLEAAGDASV